MEIFKRIGDYVEFAEDFLFHRNQLQPVPAPVGETVIPLAALLGQEETDDIVRRGMIEFHAVGDAGAGNEWQETIAKAMAAEVQVDDPSEGPVFFLNLGDIIYGPNKGPRYADQFYRANRWYLTRVRSDRKKFNGLILAVPGNHDGETRTDEDKPTLKAFLENFCGQCPVSPTLAETFGVEMPKQPGPFWHLDAPFLDLIGLYSNAAEDFGVLRTERDDFDQLAWLEERLKVIGDARAAGSRKALVLAMHHPPYGRGLQPGGLLDHGSSPLLQAQLDQACTAAGVWPDCILSGHAHNYQLYVRDCHDGEGATFSTAYIVAGTGGKGGEAVHPRREQLVETPPPGLSASKVCYLGGLPSYGYLRISATPDLLQLYYIIVGERGNGPTVTVDLRTRKVSVMSLPNI